MQRVLGVAVVALMSIAIIQFIALRRIRVELAAARAWAVASDLEARGDEVLRTGHWLHAWLQSAEGGAQVGGLCPSGAPDLDQIRHLIFGTYLQARAAGASEADARALVTARAHR